MIATFNKSTNRQITTSMLVAIVMILAGSHGCGMHDRAVVPDRSLDAQRQADTQIRMVRVEAEALRAEMAATRIAAAKQQAELQELRREAEELRQSEARLQAANAELARVNAEREEALQHRMRPAQAVPPVPGNVQPAPAPADLSANPSPAPGLPEGAVMHAKFNELQSSVGQLNAELAELKKALAGNKGARPAAAPAPPRENEPAKALMLDADGAQRIVVKPGDSLTKLARQHGVSVTALKNANRLRSDRIRIGQRLMIPSSEE
jgi:peptidoglycan hydrolase CwlO-like protein